MATKITKTDRFAMLIAHIEASKVEAFKLTRGESTLSVTKDEMVEALRHEMELLAKKNASSGEKKLTKHQESNVDLKAMIYDVIAVGGKQAYPQVYAQLTSDEEITTGRVTALLTQLYNEGKISRTKKGKDTFYEVVGV